MLIVMLICMAICSACVKTETSECAHTGGTVTCQAKAICEKCGEEYGDFADHVYGTWQHDDEKHWNECKCGASTEKIDHVYNGWDNTDSFYDYKVCECGMKSDTDAFDKTVSLFNQNITLSGGACAIKLSGIR